jgi:hypothetical protein
MKHASSNRTTRGVVRGNASRNQTKNESKPVVDTDAVISEIWQRAAYIGPVLEEILLVGHISAKWDKSG